MKSNTFEALIGAVVITFTLIFLFFGFQSMRLNNEGKYNVSAVFNRIDGIKLGSDIRTVSYTHLTLPTNREV